MNKFTAALGVGVSCVCASAMAAPVVIDDFVTTQLVEDLPGNPDPRTSERGTATSIGGFRDMEALITNYSGPGAQPEGGNSLVANNGFLAYNNEVFVTGKSTVTWDGSDEGADNSSFAVDIDGLGGLDLTGGGMNTQLVFSVLETDANVSFAFTIWDTLGSVATVTETFVEDAQNVNARIFFNEFAGIDFTTIGAIQLNITGEESADAAIDIISATNIPLPPAILMMLGGLGLLGVVRYRTAA